MKLPDDYLERVYAAVLGKIIGVYLGRPFEGWSHDRISRELGDITWYVHEKFGQPLVVTDDDITGTFTFLRALPDNGCRRDLTARQIGQAWLNYIVEGRAILWWGGMGESTEHTAFLRLKDGIEAPRSGSRELNGRIVSEQIGAQIFIDGWALVAPGDPELAVRLAGEAGRVSHDGEAVFAAQLLAAMEAAAFFQEDMHRLVDAGLSFIPADSVVRRVTDQVREWCARETDWRRVRAMIDEHHGYRRYGGHVPAVPNFAVVLMALLLGGSDLQKSLMIANTSGWDTDCNSGNVGCLLGIKEGLSLFDNQPDWRGPVADRMYLPAADSGRGITDAVSETYRVVSLGRLLADASPLPPPKDGARFHFELSGSVQGFRVDEGAARLENPGRCLALRISALGPGTPVRVSTPTFIPPDALAMKGYELLASPTLSSGQVLSARVEADAANPAGVDVSAVVRFYGARDSRESASSPPVRLDPGRSARIQWTIPDTGGFPIFSVGLEVTSDTKFAGTVSLDSLTWSGVPRVTFRKPAGGGELWRRAWVNASDHLGVIWPEAFRISQDRGTGLLITGCREWGDYRASAVIASDMAADFGLAVRVQGLRRYYALVVAKDGKVELRKELNGTMVLASARFSWTEGSGVAFSVDARGSTLSASIDGRKVFDVTDRSEPLDGGGIALVCTQGSASTTEVSIEPI